MLLVVSGAAGLELMMQPRWAASTLGPVCGHGGAFAIHCPACYVAAAMITAGLVLGLGAIVQAAQPLAMALSPVRARRPS